MTIAFVFEIFLPVVNGIVTSSHNLAQNLIARGHRVIYIAPRWRESTITDVDGVPVYYVASYETFVYPGMRNVLPWSRHVKKILQREKVDIVHATGPWLLNWAALRAARKLDLVTIQTFHTMLQEPSYIRYFTHSDALVPVLRALAWRYFGLYMRRSDAVTGPSRYVAEELSKHYPDVPIHHIPNGIDLDKFVGAAAFEETQRQFPMFNEKTFIFIGRLGPEKSVDRLINGMSLAMRRDHDIRLVLIGDGPGRRAYEDQVRELRLTKSIFFLGRITPKELYTSGLIHNAVANVTASTTESFGMTVIESMASGTPSIVPDVPGISELAEDTGLTFHRDNLEELSDRALTLAHDRALRESLGAACLRRSKEFAGRLVADRFEELYRTVMETHKDRGRR
ncbi:MAG: glycosyltransferase [Alkalispirochaeta sp.]